MCRYRVKWCFAIKIGQLELEIKEMNLNPLRLLCGWVHGIACRLRLAVNEVCSVRLSEMGFAPKDTFSRAHDVRHHYFLSTYTAIDTYQ